MVKKYRRWVRLTIYLVLFLSFLSLLLVDPAHHYVWRFGNSTAGIFPGCSGTGAPPMCFVGAFLLIEVVYPVLFAGIGVLIIHKIWGTIDRSRWSTTEN